MICRLLKYIFAIHILLFIASASLQAQTIQWRHDYTSARKEAEKAGKPLILDFGTKSCYWCRRLEVDTLANPTVAKTISNKFIPLKIDAEEHPLLTQRLRITSYPTVILADANGKILGTMEGFQEATRFHENLNRALARVANPEWMIRDYETASNALNIPDYPKAIALLKRILEDGDTRPIQVQSKRLFDQIELQAGTVLERAKRLNDEGQTAEATDTLTKLVRIYPGTDASKRAGVFLTSLANTDVTIATNNRTARAKELLTQAREDYRSKEYLYCLDRCRKIRTTYGDLEEAMEARQLEDNIKANPAFLESACKDMSKRLRDLQIELADVYLKKGDRQQAMVCLQRVAEQFPGTTEAEAAEYRLAELRGEPMRAVNFQNRK